MTDMTDVKKPDILEKPLKARHGHSFLSWLGEERSKKMFRCRTIWDSGACDMVQ